MSTRPTEALDRGAAPWLFAAALATTLPHAAHQPLWLSALASALFAWAGWLWWRNERLPGRWPLALLVAVACGGVLYEFRTLFGRDAGVAMLVVFMALKLLELRSRRDATVVVTLGYFLLLTHYFYSQSIPTGLWLLAAMTLLTATLIRLHGGPLSTAGATLRYAGLLTLQAIPFMLVLYILFPRVAGPLWGLPQDAHSGRSGLSDQMTPGNIANLALSSEIAFRVRFADQAPARDKLYWRGPVLESYDGFTWKPQTGRTRPPQIEALSPPIAYETTLEPQQQRWLLALDVPGPLPPEFALSSTFDRNQPRTPEPAPAFRPDGNARLPFQPGRGPPRSPAQPGAAARGQPTHARPGRILESCGPGPRPSGAEGAESLFRREVFLHAATAAARRAAGR